MLRKEKEEIDNEVNYNKMLRDECEKDYHLTLKKDTLTKEELEGIK